MSNPTEQNVIKHLEERGFAPVSQELPDQEFSLPAYCCLFDIAAGLQAQITCLEKPENELFLILVLSTPISTNNPVPVFASAVALAAAPVDIIAIDNFITFRCIAHGDSSTLPDLLDELIIHIRHASTAVCLPAIQLSEGKITLQQAIESVKSG